MEVGALSEGSWYWKPNCVSKCWGYIWKICCLPKFLGASKNTTSWKYEHIKVKHKHDFFPKPRRIKNKQTKKQKQSNKQMEHEEKTTLTIWKCGKIQWDICQHGAWATVNVASHKMKSSWGYGNSQNIFTWTARYQENRLTSIILIDWCSMFKNSQQRNFLVKNFNFNFWMLICLNLTEIVSPKIFLVKVSWSEDIAHQNLSCWRPRCHDTKIRLIGR